MERKPTEKYVLKGPQDGFVAVHQNLAQRLVARLKLLKKRVIQVFPDESHSSTAEWILYRSTIESAQLCTHVDLGSTAAIFCSNSPHYAPVVLALLSLGAICVPANHNQPADELFPMLSSVDPSVVVCLEQYAEKLIKVYDRCPIVVVGKDRKMDTYRLKQVDIPQFEQKAAFYLFTSGSSNITKKVTLTHSNIDVLLNSFRSSDSDIRETDVMVASSPPHWYVGFLFQLLSMDLGLKLVVPGNFSKDSLYHLVSLYNATVIFLVAQQYFTLCKCHDLKPSMLSSVKMAVMAGMPVNARAQKYIQSSLGVRTVQWYGTTELQIATMSWIQNKAPPMGSIGKLRCWVDAKVVNVKGSPLKANCEGELCFRGPYISPGSAEPGEWFHTGDLGYYDEDGYLYLLDPISDLILYRGMRVLPSELELLLLEHNCVQDVAVVGVPRGTDGQIPAAAVVLRHSTTVKDLINYVEDNFPDRNKHLRGGLYIVRFIPRTAAGKVKRRELRDLCLKLTKTAPKEKHERDPSSTFAQ